VNKALRRNIEGGETQGVSQQIQGVLGQTSEGTQWVLGESDAKGFDGERIRSLISYPKAL